MGNVTFAKTRWYYDSYKDFWKVVELSGYPTVFVDEIDIHDPARTYIATPVNGEWLAGWPGARARIIHWDLEWHLPGLSADVTRPGVEIPGVCETWASDKWYADTIGARYVVLGSHPGLANNREARGDLYDAIMLANMTHRRVHIANELLKLNRSLAPDGWDNARHVSLLGSRCMLNVHQHDNLFVVPPTRFMIAAAYHLPVISEKPTEAGFFQHLALWADYANLVMFTDMWLKQENEFHLWDFGHSLYEQLCVHHGFRANVEAAL